jgi:hypothetical protein
VDHKFSAYLSVYNDWDVLPLTLTAMKPFLEELVVVDGAYNWMLPYLTAIGWDPERSRGALYERIEQAGIPFRVISGIWRNEIEKRRAGYEACLHRWIFRIDADEAYFFEEGAVEKMLAADYAVGSMTMPFFLSPRHILTDSEGGIPRQCFLFDRQKIDPEIHLNYLWLVLTADQLPQAGKKPFPVYPDPLAFNAHLSEWRTPDTSETRVAFYTFNWMRKYGFPSIPDFKDKPIENFSELFSIVPANIFRSSLKRHQIAMGVSAIAEGSKINRAPFVPGCEATITPAFEKFLSGIAAANRELVEQEQWNVRGHSAAIDLSTAAAREPIIRDESITLQFSVPISTAKITSGWWRDGDESYQNQLLPFEIDKSKVRISLAGIDFSTAVRQWLEVQVWPADQALFRGFRAVA